MSRTPAAGDEQLAERRHHAERGRAEAARGRPGRRASRGRSRPSSAAISSIRWRVLATSSASPGGTPCRRRTRRAAGARSRRPRAGTRPGPAAGCPAPSPEFGLGAGGAAVVEVAQGGERLRDDVVAGLAGQGGDERDATGVVLVAWVVEPLGAAGPRAERPHRVLPSSAPARLRRTGDRARRAGDGVGPSAVRLASGTTSDPGSVCGADRRQPAGSAGVRRRLSGPGSPGGSASTGLPDPVTAAGARGPSRRASSPGASRCRPPPRGRDASDRPRRSTPRPATNSTIEVQTLSRRPEDVLVLDVVDAQRLDPAAAGGVGHHVERDHPAVAELRNRRSAQITKPNAPRSQMRLVEERRLEGGVLLVAGRAVARVDLQRPRQGRRPAEQLLVEPVAPAAHRLGDQDAGRQRVEDRRHPDALAPRADPDADGRRARSRPRCRGRRARRRARRSASCPRRSRGRGR